MNTKPSYLDLDKLPDLLTPSQVASIFQVDPKTVARWDKKNRFTKFRTPGGHRRIRKDEVIAFLQGQGLVSREETK